MAKITELPTTFLEHALMANPGAQVFSWGSTRKEIEVELRDRRREQALAEQRAALKDRHEQVARTLDEQIQALPRDLQRISRQEQIPFETFGGPEQEAITVLLFTSHVRAHPDDWMIARVYDSIRRHLPSTRIVVLADGTDRAEPWEYTEYKKRLRDRGWELVEFKGKHHQSLMLRHALTTEGLVTTPLVMVGEHDWGVKAFHIDWRAIVESMLDPDFSFKIVQIRQATIGSWEREFIGEPFTWNGISFVPTTMYQAPVHLADRSWYAGIVSRLKVPDFLENCEMGNVIRETKAIDRMVCYLPPGPMGRLYHMNGVDALDPREADGLAETNG